MRGNIIKWVMLSLLASVLAGTLAYIYMRPYLPREIGFANTYKPVAAGQDNQEYEPFPDWQSRKRQRALAVVIDNLPDARPQSGLEAAEVVFEVPVEGGLTRFLAIISGDNPENIGPIRSARPYLIDLAREYNGILVHAGASTEAYEYLAREKIDDLDEIAGGPLAQGAFWRLTDRPKPHNLYTNTDNLRRAAKGLKMNLTVPPSQRSYSKEDSDFQGEKINDLTVYYPNRLAEVRFAYNPEKQVFERFSALKPHLNSKGEQITAANVIVQYVHYRYLDGDGHLQLILHGEGNAYVFREGKVVSATWHKTPGAFTRFTDGKGKEIALAPGPTWIIIVPKGTRVDY